jgi:hypothetical protein
MRSISIQSIAVAGSSNVTRLTMLMPKSMSGVFLQIGEGNKEERKNER